MTSYKELAHKFIRIRATYQSRAQVKAHLQAIQFLSKSLLNNCPEREAKDLCRDDILNFLKAMTQANLKSPSKSMYLGTVKQFLETCVSEGWGNIQDRVYVYSTDNIKKIESLPKAIPEKTMADIEQMILVMPTQIARMLVVLPNSRSKQGN